MARSKENNGSYKGVKVRNDLRLAIYLRDEFKCVYCGRNLHGAAPLDVTLDHLVCHSMGGSNMATNLVTACRKCNCSRKTIPWKTYATKWSTPIVDRIRLIENARRRSIVRFRKLAKHFIENGKLAAAVERIDY